MKMMILILLILLCNSCLYPDDILEEPHVAENVELIISDKENQIEGVTILFENSPVSIERTGELFVYTFDSLDYDRWSTEIELRYYSGVVDTVEQRYYVENNGTILGIQEEQLSLFSDERGARERDLLKSRVNESGDTVSLFENGSAYSSVEADSGVWYFSGDERSYGKAIALFGDTVEYRFDEVSVDRYSEKYPERIYFSITRYEGDSHESMVPVGVDIFSL